LRQIDLAPVDLDAVRRQRLDDLARGDRAVERSGVRRALLERDLDAGDRRCDLGRRGPFGLVPSLDLLALVLEHLQVPGRRLHGEALRQQEIAGEARLDFDHLSASAAVTQVGHQDDLHRVRLRISRS